MNRKIDWLITLVPLLLLLVLSLFFFFYPDISNDKLSIIKMFFVDKCGSFYIVLGITFFILSIYFSFSKYGQIVLGGKNEKPTYSFFSWGCMMFTCGLAADILFYSFSEWIMYASNPHITDLGSIQEWSGVFPLFHWSFIPWSFYLVLAVAFGFMLHVKHSNRHRFSEACRPVLGNNADRIPGRIIDLFSVFALLAGTATTFSVATPLMATIIQNIFNISVNRYYITIAIILITCIIYTTFLLFEFKGISLLSKLCIYIFFGLLVFVLLFCGQTKYILETGIESLGRMIQNFVSLSTYMDPLRSTSFPQDWTTYYWAYWIVWCVAVPFFIGSISKGRTIKQVILGGYIFGVGSTVISFIVLGNYSLGLQTSGQNDFISNYALSGDIYTTIINVINTMPFSKLVLVLVLISMIAFYATSFDSIAFTASCYSYKNLENGQRPKKTIQLMWCILLILLPIALVFSNSSMNNIQAVSIIAAFPLGIIMILIVISFFKNIKDYLK